MRGKYRDVILPFIVLRWLNAAVDSNRQAVLERKTAVGRILGSLRGAVFGGVAFAGPDRDLAALEVMGGTPELV